MALIVADKIKVRSYSSGTGLLILESALPGFRSFAAIGDGNDCFYGVEDTVGNWEVGRATYSVISGVEQLSRIDVSSSSYNNTIVNFPAGAKTVFCTIPSAILNGLIADSQDTFRIISVSGQDDLVAGNSGDTITYVGGPGISITTDSVTDTITFANSTVISYTGGTGISLDGAAFNHINSVTAATASESGAARTLTAGSSFNVPSLTYDSQGHITASSLTTLTLSADANTFVNTASFNTSNGVLTLTNNDTTAVTVDLDGRFLVVSDITKTLIDALDIDATTLDGNTASAFATAAQGTTADSAVQPGDIGTAAAQDVGYFATAAQGTLADSALQPNGNGSALTGTAAGLTAGKANALATENNDGVNVSGAGAPSAGQVLTAFNDSIAYWATPDAGVTAVSGTAPIVSSGGATPDISIPAATAANAGHMTTAYASKLDGIAAGAQVNTGTNSGTNTGDNATNTQYSGLVTNATHSGDASGETVLTLATVATAGTTGLSTAIPVVTINAKGLTTGITTVAVVAPAGTLSGATLAAGVTASSLTSVGTLAGLTVTAAITGSVTGNASTVTTNADLTGAVTSVGNAASLGSFTSAQLATALTDETGSGASVFATSPTLVTPALGTPSALVGTNITGTAAGLSIGGNAATATNVPYSGLTGTVPTWNQNTTGNASTVTTNANLTGAVTSVGNAASLGSFTSAQLAAALTDETGSGASVFATSPTLVTPALGTPSSGIVTNLTGTASININGTVGATTPATAAVTVLTASADSAFTSTGAVQLSAGTTGQRPTGAAGKLRFNSTTTQFEGYNGSSWASVGGAAISNDTTTATDVFPLFANATSGTALTVFTGNAKLLYKPSTGELKSSVINAGNGIVVNNQTVATSYAIASGENAMSVGPITVASGQSVTVASGSRWVVL